MARHHRCRRHLGGKDAQCGSLTALLAVVCLPVANGATVQVTRTTLVCSDASVISKYVRAVQDGKYEAAASYANHMILQPQCTSWTAGSIAVYHRDRQSLANASRYTYWKPFLKFGKDSVRLREHGIIRVWPTTGSRGFYAPGTDFNLMYVFDGNCPVLGPETKDCPVPESQR